MQHRVDEPGTTVSQTLSTQGGCIGNSALDSDAGASCRLGRIWMAGLDTFGLMDDRFSSWYSFVVPRQERQAPGAPSKTPSIGLHALMRKGA